MGPHGRQPRLIWISRPVETEAARKKRRTIGRDPYPVNCRNHRSAAWNSGCPASILLSLRRSTDEGIRIAFPILRDGAPGNADAVAREDFHDAVVGQDLPGRFVQDEFANTIAHRFGGMRVRAIRRLYRRREKIFEFEHTAGSRDIFVRRHATDRRFVHGDRVRDGAQIERTQMAHAVGEKCILLAHDLTRHLENGARALIEAFHKPVGAVETFVRYVFASLSRARAATFA